MQLGNLEKSRSKGSKPGMHKEKQVSGVIGTFVPVAPLSSIDKIQKKTTCENFAVFVPTEFHYGKSIQAHEDDKNSGVLYSPDS